MCNAKYEQTCHQNCSLKIYLNIVQEREIQLLSNDKLLALWQDESSSMIGFLQSFKEFCRDIIRVALRSSDVDFWTVIAGRIVVWMVFPEVLNGLRARILMTLVRGSNRRGQGNGKSQSTAN